MRMTDFEAKLNEKLQGKAYDGYGWQSTVRNAVEELLVEAGIQHEGHLYQKQYSKGNYMNIVFCGNGNSSASVSLFGIEVKKKRGKYNRGYFGSGYYDWVFGDCKISYDPERTPTIETCWVQMLENYAKSRKFASDKQERGVQACLLLIEEFGFKSSWDLSDFIKYLNDSKYTLADIALKRLKKEEE